MERIALELSISISPVVPPCPIFLIISAFSPFAKTRNASLSNCGFTDLFTSKILTSFFNSIFNPIFSPVLVVIVLPFPNDALVNSNPSPKYASFFTGVANIVLTPPTSPDVWDLPNVNPRFRISVAFSGDVP